MAYSLGIAATRRPGAKMASFVGLTEVLFAIAFAAILLGQLIGLGQLPGGLVDDARASSAPQTALAEGAAVHRHTGGTRSGTTTRTGLQRR